jgi:hypothetical protein
MSAEQVKATCDAKFLQYDSAANKCKEGCKSGYVKKDGKCVDQAEAQNTMTERLCRALGRDWVTPSAGEGPSGAPKPSYCSNGCIDTDGSKLVTTDKDITSYCKATVTGSLGASPDISQADCATQHRIYISAAKVCSARCTTGWHLKDGGCIQLVANSGENNNGDGEGEEGGCLGGQQPTTDGTCQEDSVKDPAKDPTILKLDTNIDKKTCELLGREWESGAKDASGKKIKGCNVEKCDKKDAKLVKPENGKPYCQGYVVKIDKQKCEELHRVWVAESKACAAAPDQTKKDGSKKNGVKAVKSDQCQPPYTTYVYKADGRDECMKPSTVEKLKGIAKQTGTPFVALTNMSKAGVCNVQPHKHWNGNKCVKDKPATQNTGQGHENPNIGGDGKDPADTPGVNEAFCGDLGRKYSGSTCATGPHACINSSYELTNYKDDTRWDTCVPHTLLDPQLGSPDDSPQCSSVRQCEGESPPSSHGDDHHDNANTTTQANPKEISCAVYHSYVPSIYCRTANPHTGEPYCAAGGAAVDWAKTNHNGTWVIAKNVCSH